MTPLPLLMARQRQAQANRELTRLIRQIDATGESIETLGAEICGGRQVYESVAAETQHRKLKEASHG